MGKATTYTSSDIATAAIFGLAAIGVISGLFASTGLAPMFAMPLMAALIAAVARRVNEYRAGRRSIKDLSSVGKQFASIAIGSAGFGLVMPLLFPNGAYNSAAWLVVVNSVFLLAGLTAIPIAKCVNATVAGCAKRRAKNNEGNA